MSSALLRWTATEGSPNLQKQPGASGAAERVGGPKDGINMRIPHSGFGAQDKGDSRNHVFVGSLCLPEIIHHIILYHAIV